jgi:hypothetical protein
VLLDVSTFFTTFHGVSLDAIALFADLLAHPLNHPLLRQALGVLSTVIAIGTVLGALRVWRTKESDVLRSPDNSADPRPI